MIVPIPGWLSACVLVLALLRAGPVLAQSALETFRAEIDLARVFPGADRLGPAEGEPPAAAALAGDRRLGWVLVNSDAVNAVGYSGKPIHVAVGVAAGGEIVGAQLLKHSEPIVLIGIPPKRIEAFIDGYRGYDVLAAASRGKPPVDIVSGATVTVIVIGDTMIHAAAKVLRSRAGPGAAAAPAAAARTVDMTRTGTRSWEELLGDGSIRRLHLTLDEVNAAFARLDPRAAERPERGEPSETFIDLFVAPVSVPVIGRSLLGGQRLAADRQAILVMGRGRFSFRGSGFVRGGLFDRIELIQGEDTIRFRDRDYQRLGDLAAAGAPDFSEIGLFTLPAGTSFSPAEPWRLQLLVGRAVGPLDKVFLTWDVSYQLPEAHMAAAPPPPPPAPAPPAIAQDEQPLWQRIWRERLVDVAIVSTGLAVLTAIFFFQDFLAARPRLTRWTRTVFLAWTLLWLGWWANAQLSVVNVLTFSNALITDFRWDYFLMDPLLFILWSAVAVSLLFWGRGAFCGWLCPFGALQEFANRLARLIRVPQIAVPWGLHERLWPIKYILFLGLFGLSLYSLTMSEQGAEVEPFKTAIVLKFVRDWPFVVYAALLVVAAMFVDRFFCRYLCPLGAALAIPARLRMFEWLKRHRECGSPCQRCAIECPVQAIHPDGRINPNECIYCLHCQALYWDEHRCPAMIQRRLRRERAQAMSGPPRTRPEPIQQKGA